MVCYIVVVVTLLVASVFSTVYLSSIQYPTMSGEMEITTEHSFFIRDYWWLHLIIFAGLSFFLYKFKGFKIKNRKLFMTVMMLVIIGLCTYFVLAGNIVPRYDQRHVVLIAEQLKNGDNSCFDTNAYLFEYPFQLGIVRFYQLLGYVFGDGNYIAFQLINVIMIALTVWLTYLIFKKMEHEEYGFGHMIMYCVFLPYLVLSTLAYGSVPGLFCIALSMYFVTTLYEKKPILAMVLGAISTILATNFKLNEWVMTIAIIIFVLLQTIAKKVKIKHAIIFGVVLLATTFIVSTSNEQYILKRSGGRHLEGAPMICWIAMACQDGKMAPGWFNGYGLDVYRDNNFDDAITKKASWEKIKEVLREDIRDPKTGLSKYCKKFQSQWNNPTFESVWLVEDGDMEWLTKGWGRWLFINFTNIIHTIILTGCLLFAIFRFKDITLKELLFPLCLLGGVGFHLFWECQCMTAIPYIVMQLPVAVLGLHEWRLKLQSKTMTKKNWAIIVSVVCVLCCLSFVDVFQKGFARAEDTEIYDTFEMPLMVEGVDYGFEQ